MDYFLMAYTALGGLGVFFLGMKFLTESMQALAGDFIRRMISLVTSNRIMAVLVGLVVTAIVQSSSVSTVMFVGLVNAGLMNLMQAIGVILGANIGTTITGWILAVKIGKYGLLFIGIGIFPMLFAKDEKLSAVGKVLVALGLVFLGLELMSGAFKPLRKNDDFISLMTLFHATTLTSVIGCVIIGCIMTFVVQSSSAMLGITIALASTGAIPFQTAVALVLGENIGTTITAQLASIGATTNAKRAALSHALFNVLGTSIIVLCFSPYISLIDNLVANDPNQLAGDGSRPYIAAHIAMAHTLFNVTATILMLPFIQHLAKLVERLIPTKEEDEVHHLTYIGTPGIMNPGIALNMATLELDNMARIVSKTMAITRSYIEDKSAPKDLYDKVAKLEGITDNIQREMTTFICKAIEGTLSLEQSDKAYSLIRAADELESIADYLHSLCIYRYRMKKSKLDLSAQGWEEFLMFFNKVSEFYNSVPELIKNPSAPQVATIPETARGLNTLANEMREHHLKRMRDGVCKPLPALTFSDFIVSLRRIKNHSVNLYEALIYQTDSSNEAEVGK